MSSQDPEIERAVTDCVRTSGSPAALAHLRQLIEWALIDRLTIVSDDRDVLMRIIEQTFGLLAVAIRSGAPLNWLHWIVATALALTAEETNQLAWVDWTGRAGPEGTPHERRMMVFRIVLTLDGRCQWSLLRCVGHLRNVLLDRACHRELSRRLRSLAARNGEV